MKEISKTISELRTEVKTTMANHQKKEKNETKCLSPKQWAYVIAHNMLHLAFGHFDAEQMPGYTITDATGCKKKITEIQPLLWNMACDIYVDKFLSDIKFGQSIHENVSGLFSGNMDDEVKIYHSLLELGQTGTNLSRQPAYSTIARSKTLFQNFSFCFSQTLSETFLPFSA